MPTPKSRFTEEQIAHALRQTETGRPVSVVCRRRSEQAFYRWKKQYGGLAVNEIRRLRQLGEETGGSSSWSPLSLDQVMLQDVLAKNSKRALIGRKFFAMLDNLTVKHAYTINNVDKLI